MKKTLIWLITMVFVCSFLFIGIGCKQETEEVAEEVVAEEPVEEPAEEPAEPVEEE